MTLYTLTARVGRVQAAEIDWLWEPETVDPNKKPVVLLHGSGSGNYGAFANGAFYASAQVAPMLAYSGRKVISGWFGSQTFANDTLMARIDSALTVLGVTEAHIFGVSMGGGGAVRYASLNPTKAASIMGIIPMADIDAIYQADRGGLRANIGTAWGVTYPTPLPASSNLAVAHGPVVASNGIPRRLLYSTADTLVLPAEVTTLAASMGITAEIIDTTLGHVEGTIAKAKDLDLTAPWKDYVDWIDGLDAVA